MGKTGYQIGAVIAFAISPVAFAQSTGSGVPPARPAGSYVQDVMSGCSGNSVASATNCAAGIGKNSLKAAEVAGNAAIWRDMADYDAGNAKVLGKTIKAFGAVGDAAKLYEGYTKGDMTPAMADIAAREAIDFGVNRSLELYMGPLAPAGKMAYGAGKFVGTIANEVIRPCDNSHGQSQSVRDCLTDHVYMPLVVAPLMDAWQNRQFEQATSQEAIDAARQRLRDRMAEFDRTSSQNAAAAAQAAISQPLATPIDPGPQPDGSAINSLLMGAMLQSNLQNASRVQAPAVKSGGDSGASGACTKLDPKTGCHVGHDEKAHPGGCKKC